MQSLDPEVYGQLKKIAKQRGISMQELIRAVIVPDWMRTTRERRPRSATATRKPTRRFRRARTAITA